MLDFNEDIFEHKMFVSISSAILLDIFLILGGIKQDVIIYVHTSS